MLVMVIKSFLNYFKNISLTLICILILMLEENLSLLHVTSKTMALTLSYDKLLISPLSFSFISIILKVLGRKHT